MFGCCSELLDGPNVVHVAITLPDGAAHVVAIWAGVERGPDGDRIVFFTGPGTRKARNLDGITRKLDQKLGRAASEDEVAREMKMSRTEFYRLLDHVRGAVLVSLDESRSGEIESLLDGHQPLDPDRLNADYRKTGWKNFDPNAGEYEAVELERKSLRR